MEPSNDPRPVSAPADHAIWRLLNILADRPGLATLWFVLILGALVGSHSPPALVRRVIMAVAGGGIATGMRAGRLVPTQPDPPP